jgi:hypothetical protein
MTFWKRQNDREREKDQWLSGVRRRERNWWSTEELGGTIKLFCLIP